MKTKAKKLEGPGAITLACVCTNAYQDLRYGKGKRVHNRTAKATPTWRCTSCERERGA